MILQDFIALAPMLDLGAFCIITMLAIAFKRHHATIAVFAFMSCLLTMATLPWAATATPRTVTALLVVDGYALLYMGLVLSATMIVIGLSYRYLKIHFREQEGIEEYYLLLLLATFGGLVLTVSAHFVSFFLGLELLGLSLCSLIGYVRTRRHPMEAAVKYLLLSISASAFLLFGMALLYFESGSMTFRGVGMVVKQVQTVPGLWLGGVVLVFVGVALKLGLAPFHMWIPDVYQGAPAPITAYIATVSKGALVALLLRFVTDVGALELPSLVHLFGLLAVASMVTGNVLALFQQNVKRLLAYSSIAHVGYLLVALLAGGAVAAEAVTFYVIVYCAMTLGAFGVVTVYSREGGDAERFEDYRGLFWTRPWLAAILALSLLSLAGIPVTAGFIGKFYAIAAGVDAGLWWLVSALIGNSIIGLYYYLRLIVTLFGEEPAPATLPQGQAAQATQTAGWTTVCSLGLVASIILMVGVYPEPLMELIRDSVRNLLMVAVQRP
ncbi:MAG: NADH-ubiquinone oxidoreductase chain N [Nitrospira sp.]|jgi:NADH-quinone oxidoreductase subunit N|nr:MAG: NADH-ubiquinone oxidoreductase chain N [Nitrospira sp.]